MGFLSGGGGGGGKSGNHAWDWAKDTFADSAGQNYNGATNMLGNILGLNGSGAGSQALDDYWKSSGGEFLLDQGLDSVNNKFAGLGLSRSGAAMKGMEQYRSGLASTKLDNYLGQLGQLGQLGLGAGNLVVNAGQYSKGQGGGGGLGSLIGSVISTLPMVLPSSRDLKADIEDMGLWDDRGDGLRRVRFRYKNDPSRTRYIGVIAEEVKELRPWAFVPNFVGDKPGVNYGAL